MNDLVSPTQAAPANRPLRLRIAVGAWGLLILTGMALLTAYANEPGSVGAPPRGSLSLIPASHAKSVKLRLLMFVHPRCPCSRASLRELARIMSRGGSQVDATIYFYRPERETDAWTDGDLRNSALRIPGLQVQVDPAGRLAAQMGAHTSGDVLLYDAAGDLLFHGGITGARGHEGDNRGASAVASLLLGRESAVVQSPVFGCRLQNQEAAHD